MKILFITDNFPPEVNAPATRTYEHSVEWVRQGVEVTVLTCTPNFPKGRAYPGYKNKIFQQEEIDGIKVVRVWSYMSANEGFVKRILDYLSFCLTSFFFGLFQRTDLIIATSPQFFTTWSACALSFLKRVPWVFEVRDIWPKSIRAVGAMQGGRREAILDWFEKIELSLYRKATHVVVVTGAFKKNLISRGVDPQKISVATNGVNIAEIQKLASHKPVYDFQKKSGETLIGYIGTHGMAHGLDFILKAVKELPAGQNIRFVFIGDGAKKRELVELKNELALHSCEFYDSVAKDEVPALLAQFDACLVPLKRTDAFKEVIPSKIFEAAALEKPILLGVEGQAQEIIEKYNAGLCFTPEDQASFLQTVMDFAKGIKNDNSLTLARDFDRRKIALNMLNKMKELL